MTLSQSNEQTGQAQSTAQPALMARIQDVLAPWQTSQKSCWKYRSRVPNIPVIEVERKLFNELAPGCWTSGDSLTTYLDIWHSREYTYNPSVADSLRIANTYLYPAMKASFREADGTDAHHRCLTQGLIHFRYKARTALDATLRELFTKFDYLAIPLHVIGAHWALAIVVNANRVADADWTPNQGPALIFLLDSLSVTGSATALTRAGQEISRWFRAVMKVMLGQTREPEAFRIIQIPETAQQPNNSDCALYVHHHLRTFLSVSNPERIIPHYQGNQDNLTVDDLVELWRYPSALDCRFNVMQMIMSELTSQGGSP